MKVLSTEGLTKLIDLIKSSFISNEDTQATVAVDAVETSEVTLATVATTGAYSDLSGTPTVDQTYDGTSVNAQSGVAVASAIDTMLASLYPVGSIYIGTQATCPLATLISGSTWVNVSEGRVLQGSNNGHSAGSTIAAGLPNITGSIDAGGIVNDSYATHLSGSGAFSDSGSSACIKATTAGSSANRTCSFDASRSSSIYGNSSTVQPSAYVVNIWERTV